METATKPLRPYLTAPSESDWRKFMGEIVLELALGKASCSVLEIFNSADNATELAEVINENPKVLKVMNDALEEALSQAGKSYSEVEAVNMVVMLGVENARKIICGNQYYRYLHGVNPDESELENLTQYAQRLSDMVEPWGKDKPKWSYTVGLLFDTLRELMKKEESISDEMLVWLDELFTHSIKAGRIAHFFPEASGKSFAHQKYAFAMPFIINAGRALLSFMDPPGYLNFFKKSLEENISVAMMEIAESALYGVNHLQCATLIASLWPMFKDILPSVKCATHPELINHSEFPSHQELACLANVALNSSFYTDKEYWIPSQIEGDIKMVEITEAMALNSNAK